MRLGRQGDKPRRESLPDPVVDREQVACGVVLEPLPHVALAGSGARSHMVAATAAARGDPYCSLAWGARLVELSNEATAARVLKRPLSVKRTGLRIGLFIDIGSESFFSDVSVTPN